MGRFRTLEEARAFAGRDRYAALTGITVDALGEDWCECSMELRPEHRNGFGEVMGGAIFTLGDLAFAVAANNLHEPTVGQHVSIDFLSTARGDRLIARAQCRRNGRNLCVFNISITDDTGRDVAQYIATGFKLVPREQGKAD